MCVHTFIDGNTHAEGIAALATRCSPEKLLACLSLSQLPDT